MDTNSGFQTNFQGVKNTAGGADVRSDEQLRKFLVEVGINEGEAYKIDQFFHNDIPSSKLNLMQQKWIMGYYDVISGFLFASTTNTKSGRKYDCTPLILKAYERAKTMAIVLKADEGWATLNVLKREMIQRYHEQTDQRVLNQQGKQGWGFGNQQNNQQTQTGSYGQFERGG